MHQLLRLLHLASPALPIGAFHFSQGLELAVEKGWVKDEGSAFDWIAGVLQGSLGTLDLPILARLHRAFSAGDRATTLRWNALLLAARETEELRAEDRHMGLALVRVLRGIHPHIDVDDTHHVSYATAFAAACGYSAISCLDALQAYAWAWSENQVLAAVKLVPLGQSAGQRMLNRLIPMLHEAAGRAMELRDEDMGYCAVMQSVASARHETQYSRLFRS